jgi:hypothetical protein
MAPGCEHAISPNRGWATMRWQKAQPFAVAGASLGRLPDSKGSVAVTNLALTREVSA